MPDHSNAIIERQRLGTLRGFCVLDTAPEEQFDRITSLCADLFDVPIALVSLVDGERQWFKSRHGLEATETPRDQAFCAHVLPMGPGAVMVVEDASQDPRFSENPLVVGGPRIRFYMGAALTTKDGFNLGTLCAISPKPRAHPSDREIERLKTLARIVMDELELGIAQRGVKEQQRLLELAEATSGVGHWRYDLSSGHITWSEEVYRIHGVERGSFDPNYTGAVDFYHPDDRATVDSLVQHAAETGEGFHFQLRLMRSDGALRHVVARATTETDAQGQTVAIFGVFQDVTDQVMALETVKQSEARYRLLTENANDVVTEISPAGVFKYVSPAVTALTGYLPQEVVGRSSLDFIHPDDRGRTREHFQVALTKGGGWRIEYRICCKNGDVLWVEARPTAVLDQATGRLISVTDVLRDISVRKELEAANQAAREEADEKAHLASLAEARYRLLAENATDMIVTSNLKGWMTYASPSCQRVTGYTPAELIEMRALDFTHPDDASEARRVFTSVAAGGPTERVRWRIRHKQTQDWVWLESMPALVRDPQTQTPQGFVDVIRDVTAQCAQEAALRDARAEAEAATAVKSEFLANMSHELRTPLTSILGYSELLRPHVIADEKAVYYLDRARIAGEALLSIVSEVLDFSKLEAGQVEISLRPADPKALFATVTELVAPQAAAKGLALSFNTVGDLPPLAWIDDTRVRQILLNFASNAVKFTEAGSVTVTLSHAGERLRCEVIDTGMGVPKDRLERLFQRFSQVDASTTRSHGGTGLGLAICKGLAEAMGGAVGVASTLGQGSTFWFEIPCRAAEGSASDYDKSTDETFPLLSGLRLLVVDDNPMNRELINLMMANVDAEVSEAASGEEAIDLAEAAPFDAILMDLRMPGLSGADAAKAIRAGGGCNDRTPIIAFTADADSAEAATGWDGTFDGFVAKPIVAADLYSELNRVAPGAEVEVLRIAAGV